MDTLAIFLTQLIISIFVFALLAKWVVHPWLADKKTKIALMILIAPHSLRHIGLTFMVPSVTDPAIPESFVFTTAWGDFTAGILALIALFALKNSWKLAIPLVWIFNLEGFVDLIYALSQAEAVPTLAGTWYIPTFIVPLLLVSHIMIFIGLIKGVGKTEQR
ncbi:MAG: hypothetical protein OFPI_38510 [Osedax symbiont Rs2]|nr:MAG: hypothetical protein OFPI_38510 [Osedax symbiont Rs2]